MNTSLAEGLIEQVPQYTLNYFDDGRDEKVALVVMLPGVESAAELNVEVASRFVLVHVPGRYRLALNLETEVLDTPEVLKFVKKKSTLKAQFVAKPATAQRQGSGRPGTGQAPAAGTAAAAATVTARETAAPASVYGSALPQESGAGASHSSQEPGGGLAGSEEGAQQRSGAASSAPKPSQPPPPRSKVHESFYEDLVKKPSKKGQKDGAKRKASPDGTGSGGGGDVEAAGQGAGGKRAEVPAAGGVPGPAGGDGRGDRSAWHFPSSQGDSEPAPSMQQLLERAALAEGFKLAGVTPLAPGPDPGFRTGSAAAARPGRASPPSGGAAAMTAQVFVKTPASAAAGSAAAGVGHSEADGGPEVAPASQRVGEEHRSGNGHAGNGDGSAATDAAHSGRGSAQAQNVAEQGQGQGQAQGQGQGQGQGQSPGNGVKSGGGAAAGPDEAGQQPARDMQGDKGEQAESKGHQQQAQGQGQQQGKRGKKGAGGGAVPAGKAAGEGAASSASAATAPSASQPRPPQQKGAGRGGGGKKAAPTASSAASAQPKAEARAGAGAGAGAEAGAGAGAAPRGFIWVEEEREEEQEEEGVDWWSVEGVKRSAGVVALNFKAFPHYPSGSLWLAHLLHSLGRCVLGSLVLVIATCAAVAPWGLGQVSRRRARKLQAALNQSFPTMLLTGLAVAAGTVLVLWSAVTTAINLAVLLLRLAFWFVVGVVWRPQPVLAVLLAAAALLTLPPYHPHLFITRRLWTVPFMLYCAGTRWWCLASIPCWALLHGLSGAGWQSSAAVPLALLSLRSLSWYLALPCVLLVAAGWFCSVALAVSMAERAAGGGGGGGRRGWRGQGEQAAKGRHEVPEGASGEVARVLRSHDLYEVLELPRDADEEAVRRAKRLKSLATHPDKLGQTAAGAKEAFQRVTQAADILSDAAKRKDYDLQLRTEEEEAAAAAVGRAGAGGGQAGTGAADGDDKLYFPCSTCGGRHAVQPTRTSWATARYCSRCNTHHGANHGDCWFERRGLLLLSRARAYICLHGFVLDMTEYAECNGMMRGREFNTCTPPFSFAGMMGGGMAGAAAGGAAGRTNNKKKGRRR